MASWLPNGRAHDENRDMSVVMRQALERQEREAGGKAPPHLREVPRNQAFVQTTVIDID